MSAGRALALLLALLCIGAAIVVWTMQPLVRPIVSAPPALDPARLQAHVRALSVQFHPRSHDHPRNLDAAANYIAEQLRAAGAAPRDQPFDVGGVRYRNVVARIGPAAGPLLVIGAHYDSFGDASMHTPGADDNASGVAGLIELARLLARHPPPRAVELVAFALEEPPHFGTRQMGSMRHAGALRAAGTEVSLMISLEMIGCFSERPGSQGFPLPGLQFLYPTTGNFIAIVGGLDDAAATRRLKAAMAGATPLPVHSFNAPALVPGVDWSDHLAYWTHRYPALMVTDTAFHRNERYHGAADQWPTLDYERMAQVVRGVFAFVQQPP